VGRSPNVRQSQHPSITTIFRAVPCCSSFNGFHLTSLPTYNSFEVSLNRIAPAHPQQRFSIAIERPRALVKDTMYAISELLRRLFLPEPGMLEVRSTSSRPEYHVFILFDGTSHGQLRTSRPLRVARLIYQSSSTTCLACGACSSTEIWYEYISPGNSSFNSYD
jgi:hypothetical protein